MAAIGYASRVIYVIMLATLGMADGGAVIVAQFWGNGSPEKTRQATALNVSIAAGIATFASATCFICAKWVAGMSTDDATVASLSAEYIRIVSLMIVPFAVISALAASLRCFGEAKVAMRFTLCGVALHVTLALFLIFGISIAPDLGLAGAAWATVISTYAECLLFVIHIYRKNHPAAFRLKDIRTGLESGLLKKIVVVGGPVSLSSAAWATGLLAYIMIVGRASTQNLAALSMVNTIESVAIAVINGVSTASSVIIGSSIGEGSHRDHTWRISKSLLLWNAMVALSCSTFILLTSFQITAIYGNIDANTLNLARQATAALSVVFLFRAMSMTLQNGLLRAGGDTLYVLYADLSCQWLIAIPLTFFAATRWNLPFPLIFMAIYSEEITKSLSSGYRVYRRQWMRRFVD
ncbi:MATE family efflux transporter [Streptomyces coacervatus]|uniref:Probable multidrug resistance protein NorM n=1 Tax=Streptomyces coacervatus TaxID=647381 RepID=A0ABP7HKK8_9ACTN